jgi:hypothetical protein
MVTTAGITRSTIGAYEATGTADGAGAVAVVVTVEWLGAALTRGSGAFHAASVTTAAIAAASPPFFK